MSDISEWESPDAIPQEVGLDTAELSLLDDVIDELALVIDMLNRLHKSMSTL